MAEVLGIIAAVVGVADVGYKLSLSLYRYSHAVASPGKTIESVSSEVSLLSSVLQQLGSCLEEDEFVKLCKAKTLTTTKDIAEECKTAFEDLDDIIIRNYVESGKMKLRDRLKWPFIEKRITLLRVNLDRLKSTLMLMLEVLKYARSIVKHDQALSSVDREIIVALQQANADATLRYEKLLLAIEHGSTTRNDASTEAPPPAYIIVDENGIDITQTKDLFRKDELLSKLKKVSTLIDEVDRAQADIMEVTRQHGIWEISLTNNGHGSCHFRHTNISKHDRLPELKVSNETVDGAEPLSDEMPTPAALPKIKDMYIAVMGITGSGKSTFINLLCGQGAAGVSHTLERGTEIICLYDFMYTPEVRVRLIDTPGIDDTDISERDILRDILDFVQELHIDNIQLSGIIYLHDLTRFRMQVWPTRNRRLFNKLCGDNPLPNIILVTTKGDLIGERTTRLVENELIEEDGSWGLMINRGSRLIRHTGDKESAMRIIDSILRLTTKVVVDIQQEMFDQGAKISNGTIARSTVNGLLVEYTTVVDDTTVLDKHLYLESGEPGGQHEGSLLAIGN